MIVVRRRFAVAFAILFLCFYIDPQRALALPPEKAVAQYLLDSWQAEKGLLQNTIGALAQTPDGYLWLGTSEGLARFDGVRFTTFSSYDVPEFVSDYVTRLLTDRRGRLWIGTGDGLMVFHRGRFRRYGVEHGLADSLISSLFEDSQGRLWVGTNGGLDRMQGDRFEDAGLTRGVVQEMIEDADGSLWIAASDGLIRSFENRVERFTEADGLPERSIRTVLRDPRGNLWVGTIAGLARRSPGGRSRVFTQRDGLPSEVIRQVSLDAHGTLWIATNGGLSRLQSAEAEDESEERFENLALPGDPTYQVQDLLEDREGSLWIATVGVGLLRLRDGSATPYGRPEGLSRDNVWTVYEDSRRTLWAGTNGGGLHRLQDGRFEAFRPPDGRLHDTIYALLEDRSGSLWIGAPNGLSRFRAGELTTFAAGDGLPGNTVLAIYESRAGELWIGTSAGVAVLRSGVWTSYTVADGLASNVARAFLEDRGGRLWIATGGGVSILQDGAFTTLDRDHGLVGNLVLSLFEGNDGAIWIGTDGSGLSRIRGDEVVNFDRRSGLTDLTFNQILDDGLGRLWYSGNHGIHRLDKAELEAWANREIEAIRPFSLDRRDGMKNTQGNGGVGAAGWKRGDGSLWFATVAGLVEVDPAQVEPEDAPLSVFIEEATVDDQPQDPQQTVFLDPDYERLEIRYTALDLAESSRLRFRYRLEGIDSEWIDAGDRRTAYYSHVPPGRRRFLVAVRRGNGEWHPPSELTLVLRPAFYQTYWFYALGALGSALLLRSLHLLRIRRLLRRQQELIQIKDELRAKTAELKKLAYIFSHDLKNPLFTIQGYLGILREKALQAGRAEMLDDLDKIRDAAEETERLLEGLHELRELEERIGRREEVSLRRIVENVVARRAEEIADRGAEVSLVADLPRLTVVPEQIEEVFDELLGNALKFMGPQSFPRIEIGSRIEREEAIVWVSDNGIGLGERYREKVFGLFEQLDQTAEGIGMGLAMVRRIMELHDGRVWMENAEPQGCVVYLAFPDAESRR